MMTLYKELSFAEQAIEQEKFWEKIEDFFDELFEENSYDTETSRIIKHLAKENVYTMINMTCDQVHEYLIKINYEIKKFK